MITFKNYTFKFFYSPNNESGRKTFCKLEKSHRGIITNNAKTKVVGVGIAVCSVKDNFCKEKGRKLAMLRAMKNAGIPKSERTLVWGVYRDLKSGGRW